jgi:hypothetical protein
MVFAVVVVSFIGSDQELAAAAPAWTTVRRSLKIDDRTIAGS